MGHKFAELAFTESVRQVQESLGSRAGYAGMDGGEDHNHVLGEQEAAFIQARDSFYMATVSESGWPYVQHRGGPAGFVRILDERTLGFADFRGNRQYVSVGNLRRDDRVSLFFMDYPNRVRLKVLGRVQLLGLDSERLGELEPADYRARVERGFLIHVEAFDWNCPQHITPRYTESEVQRRIAPLLEENQALKADRDARPARPTTLGDGPLELVISGVRQLTPRVRWYELSDPQGAALPAFEPGAHLRVPVRLESGAVEARQYSICSDPARRDVYEIAVLRQDSGAGGSRAVHDDYALGVRLRCEPPENFFRLHGDDRPSVLIAGGIGITPILSMARALRAAGAGLHLHYAARSEREMAFRDQLRHELQGQLSLYRLESGEQMDLSRVIAKAPRDAVFYVCGPAGLLEGALHAAAALGVAPDRIRFERFAAEAPSNARPIQVTLQRSGRQLRVAPDQTVLDAILEAGVDAPFSCKAGNCRTCAVKVLGGEPEHRDSALSVGERETQRLMCPCISRAVTDHLILDL